MFVSGRMARTNEDPEQCLDGAGDLLLELFHVLVPVAGSGEQWVSITLNFYSTLNFNDFEVGKLYEEPPTYVVGHSPLHQISCLAGRRGEVSHSGHDPGG